MNAQALVDPSAWPYAAGEIVAAAICVLTARFTWRHRARPGALALSATLWACTWWSFWHAVSLLSAVLSLKLALADLWYLGAAPSVSGVLIFALEFRRQSRVCAKTVALLLAPAALTVLAVWTNPWLDLYWKRTFLVPGPPFTRLGLELGPATFGFVLWETVALVTTTVLLLRLWFEHRGLYRRQVAFTLLGIFGPWMLYMLFVSGHPLIPSYDLTTLSLALGISLVGWAVYGYKMLDILPIAHHLIIDGVSDAVVVVDDRTRLVYANQAASELMGADDLLGRPLTQAAPDLAALLGSGEVRAELTRGVGTKQRVYDVRLSSVRNRSGETLGRALTLRDDTERRRSEQLQRSRQQVIAAEESVRQRIAEFLHGPVQTKLLTAWMRLGDYEKRRSELSTEESGEILAGIRDHINRVREDDIRRVSHLLHPPALRLGLMPAIDYLAGGFDDVFTVEVCADDGLRQLDMFGQAGLTIETRLVIYRVVEEALNNAAKHAGASHVDVWLNAANGTCEVRVTDDGQGFDPSQVQPGFGFHGIAGRVEQIGGEWSVSSQPGKGTTLQLTLPL